MKYIHILEGNKHMKTKEGPGLLDRVQNAVEPLIIEKNFQLESIQYGTYYRDVEIRLTSTGTDILFQGKLSQNTEVYCYFIAHSISKTFNLKYLALAMKINIPFKKGDYIRNLNLEQFRNDENRYYKEIEYLLNKTDFIGEVTRLSIEIKQKLEDIYPLFYSENVDETILRYTREFRRHEQYGGVF